MKIFHVSTTKVGRTYAHIANESTVIQGIKKLKLEKRNPRYNLEDMLLVVLISNTMFWST